jgi:hypothetical protein
LDTGTKWILNSRVQELSLDNCVRFAVYPEAVDAVVNRSVSNADELPVATVAVKLPKVRITPEGDLSANDRR